MDAILSIDLGIIDKLTDEQREEMTETIEKLEEAVENLKEVL